MVVTPDKIIYFVIPIIVLPYFFHERTYRLILLYITLILPIFLVLYFQMDFSIPHYSRPVFFVVSMITSMVFLVRFEEIRLEKKNQNDLLLDEIEKQKKHLSENEKELNGLNKKLSIQNKELEDFVYIASHDLKQPIRNTISYVQLLKKKLGPSLDLSKTEQLQHLESNALKINQLIKDLLSFSRIGKNCKASKFEFERLVRDCMVAVSEKEQKTFELKANCNIDVFAKRSDIEQLVEELISNAVQANPHQEDLLISVEASKNLNLLTCIIEDSGNGIPDAKLEFIQQIFNKVDKDEDGSGIGTAICQKVVAGHNGTIEYIKSDLGGLKVTFTIEQKQNDELIEE